MLFVVKPQKFSPVAVATGIEVFNIEVLFATWEAKEREREPRVKEREKEARTRRKMRKESAKSTKRERKESEKRAKRGRKENARRKNLERSSREVN